MFVVRISLAGIRVLMRTDEGQGTIDLWFCSNNTMNWRRRACANQSSNQKISHLNNSPLLVERDLRVRVKSDTVIHRTKRRIGRGDVDASTDRLPPRQAQDDNDDDIVVIIVVRPRRFLLGPLVRIQTATVEEARRRRDSIVVRRDLSEGGRWRRFPLRERRGRRRRRPGW